MFINVLWKSPQKQFTGETYRFTIILDTSASSTSKSSTLTTLAESHPVPVNRSTAPSSGPPTGCVFSQSGSSNESNRAPAGGRMFTRVEPSYLVPILHHSHFKMKPLESKEKKKGKTKTRQSLDAAPAVKDTTVRRLSYCSDAFGSAAEQTRILNHRKEKRNQVKSVKHVRTLVKSTCWCWRNVPHLRLEHWMINRERGNVGIPIYSRGSETPATKFKRKKGGEDEGCIIHPGRFWRLQ